MLIVTLEFFMSDIYAPELGTWRESNTVMLATTTFRKVFIYGQTGIPRRAKGVVSCKLIWGNAFVAHVSGLW